MISRIINFSTIEVEPFEGEKGKKLGFDEPILIRVEDADTINYSYAYSEDFGVGFGTGGMKKTSKEMSDFAKNIINKINNDDDEDEDVFKGEVLEAKTRSSDVKISVSEPMVSLNIGAIGETNSSVGS
jgi:hypothetical protein